MRAGEAEWTLQHGVHVFSPNSTICVYRSFLIIVSGFGMYIKPSGTERRALDTEQIFFSRSGVKDVTVIRKKCTSNFFSVFIILLCENFEIELNVLIGKYRNVQHTLCYPKPEHLTILFSSIFSTLT